MTRLPVFEETRTTELMTDVLGRNMYRSAGEAALEYFFNSADAVERAVQAGNTGLSLDMHIRFYAKAEHPLSPNGRAVAFRDNAGGFLNKSIKGFCQPGKSVNISDPRLHGRHGVGARAGFYFGSAIVITTRNQENGFWTAVYDAAAIRKGKFTAQEVNPKHPHLPKDESFTEFLVTGLTDEDMTPQYLTGYFAKHLPLPIIPFTVTIQGKVVPLREIKMKEIVKTPIIPAFGEPILIQLVTSPVARRGDTVVFYDTNGRAVGDLIDNNTIKLFDTSLTDGRIVGMVFVPGIEKFSLASRWGVQASFWRTAKGRALIDVLNSFGVDVVKKLLGDEKKGVEGPLGEAIKGISDQFAGCWGKPAPWGNPPGSGNDDPKPRPDPTGDPKPRPDPTGDPKPPRKGTFIRIGDATYSVLPTNRGKTGDEAKVLAPVWVMRKSVLIDFGHPLVEWLQSQRSPVLARRELTHLLIGAHVAAVSDGEDDRAMFTRLLTEVTVKQA